MKTTTTNRRLRFAAWAGLLILSSLALPVVAANNNASGLRVTLDDGLVTVRARNMPLQDIVREIAAVNELRLVQHLALDRLVNVDIEKQTLLDVLDKIFEDESYQLYRTVEGEDNSGAHAIPGALWIFSEGSAFAPAATAYLETVLLRGDIGEKKESIRELRRLGTPEAVQVLSVALADEDRRVRRAAMEALSRVGGDEAMAALASAYTAEDLRVRADATIALAIVGGDSSIEYLKLALRDESPIVRAAAIDALGDIGDERSIGVIQQALQDPDPDVRERALEVIDEINDEVAFRVFFPTD